ncbi:MAG: hypothetical protein II767_09475 [Proteobacteria bacterium]|nr:hypothetical protein [Pseudomonadota bacterium]
MMGAIDLISDRAIFFLDVDFNDEWAHVFSIDMGYSRAYEIARAVGAYGASQSTNTAPYLPKADRHGIENIKFI